jgi:DNA polymerase I-like protein with 3'-5' exonuclease and polymerase domains
LCWDDEQLFTHLGHIKKLFKDERNSLYKHLVHAINFGQGPKGAQDKIYKETSVMYDVKHIAHAMDIYKKELFPSIPRWQQQVRLKAHEEGHLRNAWGYVHRFNHVFSNKLRNGIWERVLGDDAEAVLAFKPQSTAAGIMKECLLRMYQDRFEEAGQWLRMTIHDEIFCEVPEDYGPRIQEILREEMERPIEVLPLPAEWNMGAHLVVLSEGKGGTRWSEME